MKLELLAFKCDIPDCRSRSTLDPATPPEQVEVELVRRGWRVVTVSGETHHLCPGCAHKPLETVPAAE